LVDVVTWLLVMAVDVWQLGAVVAAVLLFQWKKNEKKKQK
jgi:hypothetical protein